MPKQKMTQREYRNMKANTAYTPKIIEPAKTATRKGKKQK